MGVTRGRSSGIISDRKHQLLMPRVLMEITGVTNIYRSFFDDQIGHYKNDY